MISVGIDVSKGKSTVCILKPYGELVRAPYEVEHTETGLSELAEQITCMDEEVKAVMEATGAYHLPVLSYLKQKGIFVSVVNPLVMKKYSNVKIRKGKTDKLDAVKIANYGIEQWYQLSDFQPQQGIYEELDTLCRQYSQYIDMRIKSKITLSNLLDKTMPGITKLLRNASENPNRDKLNAFVKEYWHYDQITRKSEDGFVKSYVK